MLNEIRTSSYKQLIWYSELSGIGTIEAVAALAATLFRPQIKKKNFITCYKLLIAEGNEAMIMQPLHCISLI